MTAVKHPTMAPGRWWGCEHPERPYDTKVNYHNACRACWLAAKAAVYNGFADKLRRSRDRATRTLAEWVGKWAHLHERAA